MNVCVYMYLYISFYMTHHPRVRACVPGERDWFDNLEHDKFPKPDDPWVEDTRTEEDIVRDVIFLDEEERNHRDESRRFGITALMRACACKYLVTEKEKADGDDADGDDADDEESRTAPYVYLCNDGGIVILLLLMLGADPKMGHWKSFGRAHFNYTGMVTSVCVRVCVCVCMYVCVCVCVCQNKKYTGNTVCV